MVGIDRKIDRCKARYKDRWVDRLNKTKAEILKK